MTLATRTKTRNAPWAAVLTALLAIVALVFGAMALAGPANAKDDKPDNPGNSQNAPGQQDDGTPGNSDGVPGGGNDNNDNSGMEKITICHYVEGKGETKAGYNIITIALPAWKAHLAHHPDTMDVVYNGVSCPGSAPTYTATATYVTSVCEATTLRTGVVFAPAYTTEPFATQELANAAAASHFAATWQGLLVGFMAANPQYTPVPASGTCETGGGGITPEQAAAIDAAIAAAEPETVAPVLPATVAEQPETVAVPAPAKVTPAAVPAGDGSSVPQAPVALLALLALATAGAVASGLRLAMNR